MNWLMALMQPVRSSTLADSVSLNLQTGYGSRRLHIPQWVTEEDGADDILTVLTAQLLEVMAPSQTSLEQVAHDVSAAVFDQHTRRQQKEQNIKGQKVRCTRNVTAFAPLTSCEAAQGSFHERLKWQKMHWLPGTRLAF